MKAVVLLILLTGCSALPSMRYCQEVNYHRKGADIEIQASCTAPVGSGL
jgi:hypothetical protein